MSDITTVTIELPRWVWMWLLAGGMFALTKAGMLLQAAGLAGWRGWAYTLLWPGMEISAWEKPRRLSVEPPVRKLQGLTAVLAGAALVWGVARCWSHPLLAGWTGMIGIVLMLHFGLFRMLAAFWQRCGIPVVPLMDSPLLAVTVAEFWGRRWNRAFRDLSQTLLARPVTRRWGVRSARWVVFLVSGMAHELVISVPAGGGYGLPAAYFALQAWAMDLEKRKGLRGRFWTVSVIGVPAIFLFHPPFVERVILPFLQALGALP